MIYLSDHKDLIYNKKYNLLYFYTQWMPFHKKYHNMMFSLEKKYDDLNFYCIDIDYHKNMIKIFELNQVPTFIILDNKGKEITRNVGLIMTSAFKSMISDIYKKEV